MNKTAATQTACCGLYTGQYGCKTHSRARAAEYICCMLWTMRYGCKSHKVAAGTKLRNR